MKIQKLWVAACLLAGSLSASAQLLHTTVAQGPIEGVAENGLASYKGIPFAQPPVGDLRWKSPVKAAAWTGTFKADHYASKPYQQVQTRPGQPAPAISEDCLYLNVLTPAKSATEKLPVLVWIHGGGFSTGASFEQNGTSFAKNGIVYVAITYRVNVFGFLSTPALTAESLKETGRASSGNYGLQDQIMALQWVHDNIANFGGDPGNVTIIGQSGGGSKVCTVAAMPAAKGLVHKAVALSGNSTSAADKETAEALGAAVLAEAGLKPSEIDKLQQMPWEEFYAIANKASRSFAAAKGIRAGFSPVGDDIDIPAHFYEAGREDIPDVPMILCSTSNEFVSSVTSPELEENTREDIIKMIEPKYGDKAAAIYDEYAKLFPDDSPYGVYSVISSSRDGVFKTATTKLQQTSPVYVAWFRWYPNLMSGRMRAFHCLDICFWFNNTDLMYTHTGGSKKARVLSDKMAASLAQFMRTGDPNGAKGGLPAWGQFTPEGGETMVLDDVPSFGPAPDAAARALIAE